MNYNRMIKQCVFVFENCILSCASMFNCLSCLQSDWIVFYAVSAMFQPYNGGLQSKVNDIDNVSLLSYKSILKCASIRSSCEI